MKHYENYERAYFMPPECTYDWVKKEYLTKAPIWCSVDLRDGNQALVEPMSLEEKIQFFQMLVKIGFKQIEVGFPAASETEYDFVRTLIEQDMIPEDVTIQVLTQAREHIIRKTFEAIEGAQNVIVHLYLSTSVAQREQVFHKSKEEIIKTAVDGAIMVKELADKQSGNIYLQYSPESCTGTEVDYAVEICNAVLDIWQPTPDHKAIINIPATVENSIPHVFATQIEYIHKHLKYRDAVLLSLHPHNDRGCAVADAELGVLAGADRIEGTLFGNGERTGNMDIVTMAMNLFSHGIDPELDFSDISAIRAGYETYTGMKVHERQPYAGDLVFTAFSGSHQDAISKGMTWRVEHKTDKWTVPYLPIDPKDIGRTYDGDVIRINSQSGKGGISYILKQNFGVVLPEAMREDVGYAIKQVSDEMHQELSPQNVYEIFEEQYLHSMNYFRITESHFKQLADGIMAEVTILNGEKETVIDANGNGRLDAVSNAVKQFFNIDYTLMNYEEHALTQTTSSKAIAYVCIKKDNTTYWGAGIDEDIIKASIQALCVSVNKMLAVQKGNACEDVRLTKMLNYIQNHYQNVTLADMSQEFHLTEPYISKYIREKSGVTFGEHVTNIRMKKACTLLKNGNMTAENIASSIGYPNVEHFSRTFKKKYHMTPIQYRESKN